MRLTYNFEERMKGDAYKRKPFLHQLFVVSQKRLSFCKNVQIHKKCHCSPLNFKDTVSCQMDDS